jgi:cell division protein FtsB
MVRCENAGMTAAPEGRTPVRRTPERRTPARSALTPRAAILTVVIALVGASVALPLRDLVAQRSRINALRDRQTSAAAELREMNAQIARWNDPAFVAVQARERLHFVLPGQVGYVVLEADNAPVLIHGTAPKTARSQSWYAAVWGGVRRAGLTALPPAGSAPEDPKAKK